MVDIRQLRDDSPDESDHSVASKPYIKDAVGLVHSKEGDVWDIENNEH